MVHFTIVCDDGNIIGVLIGAAAGLVGVGVGAWLQGRKEHQHWLRDHKLQAAIDFIGGTGDVYDRRYQLQTGGDSPIDERAALARAQDARSVLYLPCGGDTVDAAEAVIRRVRHTDAGPGGAHDEIAFDLLRDLVSVGFESNLGHHQLLGKASNLFRSNRRKQQREQQL